MLIPAATLSLSHRRCNRATHWRNSVVVGDSLHETQPKTPNSFTTTGGIHIPRSYDMSGLIATANYGFVRPCFTSTEVACSPP